MNIFVIKNCFFEKLNEVDKPLEILIEEKDEKMQIMNLRNKRDPIGTKRIIREYNELLSANKLTIDEMDKSFIKYKLPKHTPMNVRSMNQGKLEVFKQEMARVNIDILGISKLKWTGMGEFNSDDHYIYYCGQESLRRKEVALIVNKRV